MPSNKLHYVADPTEISEENGVWKFNPRGFSIIWGSDNRYWDLPEKGSGKPAELVQVCWLELTGTTNDNVPAGKYEIKFRLSTKQGAFGLSSCPIFIMAKVGKKGRYKWEKINKLMEKENDTSEFDAKIELTVDPTDDRKLYFGLYEVWTGKWKGGLLIHGATVERVNS